MINTRMTAALAGIALAAGLTAACSTDETAPEATSTPSVSHTPAATPSPQDRTMGIVDAITAAGGECERAAGTAPRNCTLDGVSFELTEDSWQADAADRRRACDEGYVNTRYQLLTDGDWTISTDQNADYLTIQDALAPHGINAEIKPYCGES